MFGITAFSEDTYSSLANTFSGVASITGSATVTATSYGQFVTEEELYLVLVI